MGSCCRNGACAVTFRVRVPAERRLLAVSPTRLSPGTRQRFFLPAITPQKAAAHEVLTCLRDSPHRRASAVPSGQLYPQARTGDPGARR